MSALFPLGQKMKYNPEIHHRYSIRLKGYDYSLGGAYFVTICTQDRACLFGEVMDGEMRLNEAGRIVRDEWVRSVEIRAEIELDEYVVMPNHFHGIVLITNDAPECRGDRPVAQDVVPNKTIDNRVPQTKGDRPVAPTGPQSKSIGALMAGFKSVVTKRINKMRDTYGTPVWQRNFYEHIIRDEVEFNRIREYVINNPAEWDKDEENPYTWDRGDCEW